MREGADLRRDWRPRICLVANFQKGRRRLEEKVDTSSWKHRWQVVLIG